MVRLKNTVTGVVVVVSEKTAGRLAGFEPVEKAKKAPAKTEK